MCKNGNTCIFLSSKSCEFLHEESWSEINEFVKNIYVSIAEIKASVKYIDKKVEALDTAIKQRENVVSEMEKSYLQI